VITECR